MTEFDFTLPKGLVDTNGEIHRNGMMRLATAKDEIVIQKDPRTQMGDAYSALVMFSRVITRLGTLSTITPDILENLFTPDFSYLQEFYNHINQQGTAEIPVQVSSL
ncbi:phage tail assembly protein [Kovacikia minuta]|uniref:phage tail assembly protein n=1 Tax=Kovacikia minuta TaxID=2931930 RepID=UPI0028F45CFA|nr:phage tail assembly protein [Kovacikia minuta]